jgi:uncharacterized membrane protein (Fun14 family)
MIDLNYKPKNKEQDDISLGGIILAVLPFAAAFWMLIELGL